MREKSALVSPSANFSVRRLKKSVTFSSISAEMTCFTPFVSRKSLEISTMARPLKSIFMRLSSVTTATGVAARFSSAARRINSSCSFASTTTAMRSCDSEMASSVPESPSYLRGTLSRLMTSPSESSPMATETPPAPKSLHFLMRRVASLFKNSLCNLRSVRGLPFCTSAPQVSTECASCALDEPVAPPQPSRPVSPPSRMMTSPAFGFSRYTMSRFAPPTTKPVSSLFAL